MDRLSGHPDAGRAERKEDVSSGVDRRRWGWTRCLEADGGRAHESPSVRRFPQRKLRALLMAGFEKLVVGGGWEILRQKTREEGVAAGLQEASGSLVLGRRAMQQRVHGPRQEVVASRKTGLKASRYTRLVPEAAMVISTESCFSSKITAGRRLCRRPASPEDLRLEHPAIGRCDQSAHGREPCGGGRAGHAGTQKISATAAG